jgi:hypothetical protein
MKTYLPVYSDFFSTIYDEPRPVGFLGRGTHYSILRCAEWFDVTRRPLDKAEVHDFAVIWDEDHDVRVIQAIEQLYVAGLLSPVQFIGERKACLTVVVAAKFYFHGSESTMREYERRLMEIAQGLGFDVWHSEVGVFDRAPGNPHQNAPQGIIADDEHRVLTYLSNIDSLWKLGTRPYKKNVLSDHES